MIVAVLIVKDEAHVIRRCLESVRPFVDAFVIVDTGSTDDTFRLCLGMLDAWDAMGTVQRRPWVNFAHNRNEALDLAREMFSRSIPAAEVLGQDPVYALTIDADEVLVGDAPIMRSLPATDRDEPDGYRIPVDYAGTRYERLALIRLDRSWRWVGPVHEYLELEGANVGTLTAPSIRVYHEGARSRDPETYRKDAALLETALETEPDNPRYQFYLGQSYKDAGALEAALEAYQIRADNPAGYADERFISLLQIARLTDRLGWPGVENLYLEAYAFDTSRAEPLVDLATYERLHGRFAVAALYARAALDVPHPPSSALFIEEAAYGARAWDELAVSAFYCGSRDEALQAAVTAADLAPDDERLAENLRVIRENQ